MTTATITLSLRMICLANAVAAFHADGRIGDADVAYSKGLIACTSKQEAEAFTAVYHAELARLESAKSSD